MQFPAGIQHHFALFNKDQTISRQSSQFSEGFPSATASEVKLKKPSAGRVLINNFSADFREIAWKTFVTEPYVN